ncbi:hypothetical protein ACILG0_22515 [Pseudomonadota bacterium AL_CKDN230030165-1A_HGKHYDSX7]
MTEARRAHRDPAFGSHPKRVMRGVGMAALLWVAMLAGCNSEPAYQGVSFVVYNYTPDEMDWVRLSDEKGGRASTMQISVGAGAGSVSCCHTLRGTAFKAQWQAIDPLEFHRSGKDFDSLVFRRVQEVTFPATEPPPGDGPLYLELHIYPDEHLEMALSRKLTNNRLPIVDTARWLWREHRSALQDFRDGVELTRVVARVTKTSWGKYRIEDAADMRQYMRMYFTVASNFDQDPEIATVLERPDRQAGEFARLVERLPANRIAQLKTSGTPGGKDV